jgi:hypothetical protein
MSQYKRKNLEVKYFLAIIKTSGVNNALTTMQSYQPTQLYPKRMQSTAVITMNKMMTWDIKAAHATRK